MREKYISPYTDFGFKRIFGQEANKDILIAFLNAILPARHQVEDVQILKTELTPPNIFVYTSVLDLYCVTPSGERFIVEMQQKSQPYFIDRSIYYTASAITNMIKHGVAELTLPAVYFIGIMGFVHGGEGWKDSVIREVSLKDRFGAEVYDKLRMFFIQMPLFKKTESELEKPLDKWLYFIKNLPDFKLIPEVFGEPVFQKAFETAEMAAMTEEEQIAYEHSMKVMRDNNAVSAHQIKKAKDEGLAEGEAKGEAKGIRTVAAKMKREGFATAQIAALTGLSENEINAI